MSVEEMPVRDLPFSGKQKLIQPGYWDQPPDHWHAKIWPCHTIYGNGIMGSSIVYMAFKPERRTHNPMVNTALGEFVVHDLRDDDDVDSWNRSIEDGEIIARFAHYTQVKREWSGGAPECPSWGEANDMAKGFAWGYVKGEKNAKGRARNP